MAAFLSILAISISDMYIPAFRAHLQASAYHIFLDDMQEGLGLDGVSKGDDGIADVEETGLVGAA